MNNRATIILNELQDRDEITVHELSELLDVSLVTVRKDISKLEREGLIERKRGKIVKPSNAIPVYQPYSIRESSFQNEKMLIAKKAAELIKDDASISLDSGSTTYALATVLLNRSHISIVTNSICAANLLIDSTHSVYLAGGNVLSRSVCTVGIEAERQFKQIRSQKAFISTTGIRDNLELTVTLDIEASIKKAIIETADEVILLADSSKFSNASLFTFCKPDKIDKIITTHPGPSNAILKIIEENNIELIFADYE